MAEQAVDYDKVFNEYMSDILRENEAYRNRPIRTIERDSPKLSDEAETKRQAKAVDTANAAEDDVVDLDAAFVDLDTSNEKVVDLDSQGRAVPSFRQGSVSDIQLPKTTTEQFLTPRSSIPWESELPTPIRKVLRGTVDAVSEVGQAYEEAIAGPYARTAFKEDPLETMAKRAPGPDASVWDHILHSTKTLGVGLLRDPLTALGPSVLTRPRPKTAGPTTAGEAPPASPGPATPPVQPVMPSPTAPLEPSITELAKAARDQQLTAAAEQQAAQRHIGMDQTEPARLVELPTGTISRQQRHEPDPLVFESPQYSTLPTGSLVRVRPVEEQLGQGLPPETPVLPSERGGPKERTIFESRPLHGRGKVKDAFDLLREKRYQQEKLYNDLLKTRPVPDEPVPEPSVLYHKTPLMKQPEQAGPASDTIPVPAIKSGAQRSPHMTEKALFHALDVFPQLGPYTARLRDILHYTRDYSEQGTLQNLRDYAALLKETYGEAKVAKQLQSVDWSNPRQALPAILNTSVEKWGISLAEKKALVELHVAEGDLSRVSEYAKEHLPVRDPKVQKLFHDGWQIATGRASSHPIVQNTFMITDPITGEKYPVGSASPYWPHQAVNQKVKQILSEEHLRKIYGSRNYADKGISFDDFKTRFRDWWDNKDDAVHMKKFAGLEYKRFFDPLADANSHKRSVYDSLEKMGYETDPLRMLVRHNSGALKRIAYAEHADEIKQLMNQVGLEYGLESKTYNWINKILQRAQGISKREDTVDNLSNAMKIAQSIAYPAFLKASWKQNFLLQPNYAVLQIGLKPVLESTWRFFGGKLGYTLQQSADAARRSGAIFPDELMRYHLPDGFWPQYAKTMQTTNLFSVSDRMTRMLTGMAEEAGFHKLAHKFWQDPTNKKYIGLLRERNINPDELYRDLASVPREQYTPEGMPVVPEKYILRAMQVSSNRAMGRTGVHSLQAWASIDSELAHALMMLHRQVASNEGMLVNSIVNAPTAGIGIKRALTFIAGAEAAGLMYNGIVNMLVGNDFFDVNKSMVKTFGGNKEAALAAKAFLMGMGTLTAGIVMSGLQAAGSNKMAPAYALFSPPIAALIDETGNKLLHGEFGEAALRLQPSETVTTISRYGEQKKRERERQPTTPPDPLRLRP